MSRCFFLGQSLVQRSIFISLFFIQKQTQEWYFQFIDLDEDNIINLSHVANYLDIKPLLELVNIRTTHLFSDMISISMSCGYNLKEEITRNKIFSNKFLKNVTLKNWEEWMQKLNLKSEDAEIIYEAILSFRKRKKGNVKLNIHWPNGISLQNIIMIFFKKRFFYYFLCLLFVLLNRF